MTSDLIAYYIYLVGAILVFIALLCQDVKLARYHKFIFRFVLEVLVSILYAIVWPCWVWIYVLGKLLKVDR